MPVNISHTCSLIIGAYIPQRQENKNIHITHSIARFETYYVSIVIMIIIIVIKDSRMPYKLPTYHAITN
jgi:hypothetical protein